MSPKRIRTATEDLIKEYLPANMDSNTGVLQKILLTALQENADETKNKFHINLGGNKSVKLSPPAGEITNSVEEKTFDELSVYFKLKTKLKVNNVVDEGTTAWLWRFASEDFISSLTDLLQIPSDALELHQKELEHILSFGLTHWNNNGQSSIGIGLGDPSFSIPIISLESNEIGTKSYAIEVSHIKVFVFFRKMYLNSIFNLLQGRMEIKVDDILILGVDIYSIATLFQEITDNVDAEDAETLKYILMKFLDTIKKSSFKNVSLYRGTDAFESQNTNYMEPDVSFEYFQYENGKSLW